MSFTTACVLCSYVCVCTCSRAFCQRAHLKICLRLWHHDSMRQKKGVGDQTTAQSFWPFTSHTTFLSCRLSHTLLLSIQRFCMSAWGHLKPIMAPVKVFTELHIFFESLGRSFFKKHLCEVWSHRFFKFIFFKRKVKYYISYVILSLTTGRQYLPLTQSFSPQEVCSRTQQHNALA